MAQDQKKNVTGGNTPKPAAGGRPGANVSAKDRSRAQSRPVTGKAPSGKGGNAPRPASGGGKGGNAPRPGGKASARPKPSRLSGAVIAWSAVGLVVVIIVVLIVVKVTGNGSSSNASYTPVTPAPASVVKAVTNIPASVYDKVGVTLSDGTLNQPIVLSGQKPLTLDGKSPAMLYYGGEFCPYCAAERWAVTAALSRFGTWSNLEVTASSLTDVNAGTNTFSFRNASLDSPYLSFTAIEACTNIPDPSSTTCDGNKPLQTPTKEEQVVLNKYSAPKYIPGATAGEISFPFIDIGNVMLIGGASFSPGILAGQSHQEIASNLTDPTNPATQAIVGTANYISAGICTATGQKPASVCQSAGVMAAAKALKPS